MIKHTASCSIVAVLVLVLGACSAVGHPGTDDAPSSTPTPSATSAVSERPRPTCTEASATLRRSLAADLRTKDISIARGSTVPLPTALRRDGYTRLVGVTLSGAGVDGQGAVLAVGDGPSPAPLPVNDLAIGTFTKARPAPPNSALAAYRTGVAASEATTDALVCTAGAG